MVGISSVSLFLGLFISFSLLPCCFSHFHYVPEIAAAFFWAIPASINFQMWILPLFYPIYLTLLLADRAWRDDKRCADKYGKYWDMYCNKVPSKIIPGVV
jgi:7-dehydrocholesterol reductase